MASFENIVKVSLDIVKTPAHPHAEGQGGAINRLTDGFETLFTRRPRFGWATAGKDVELGRTTYPVRRGCCSFLF